MSIVISWLYIAASIFCFTIVLTSCATIKSERISSNDIIMNSTLCTRSIHEQVGYDINWTIMVDDHERVHYINLTDDYKDYKEVFEVDDNWVKFYLYTRRNIDNPEELFPGNKSQYFMPDKPLKILSHGWHGDREAMVEIRDAYLNCCDANVLVVDWGAGASEPYYQACKAAAEAAKQVGQMAWSLMNLYSLNASRIDLVGHSLGAHVVGWAGRWIKGKSLDESVIGRIFGLDPARPFFELLPLFDGLSINDGKFVEVVHTNGGYFGVWKPLGHVGFYVNGGSIQPGCSQLTEKLDSIGCMGLICSHVRAKLYFAESVVTGGFSAHLCDNYEDYEKGKCNQTNVQHLGELCDPQARGTYYLDTNSKPPFSRS